MGKTQILIVEDEILIAESIKISLQYLGYDVSAMVASGEEAIKNAAENRPSLVLMDIVLIGEIDGIEAANEIRSRFDIPVVYLTAHEDEETLERAKITEPFGYIIKPYNERELHRIIKMALYKHKMEKRLKESAEWLSTILNSVGDAVIATDVNDCVKFMNPVAEVLTGWKQEDAVGEPLKDIFNIISEKTGEKVEDAVKRVIREGVVVGLANYAILMTKNGTKRAIADTSSLIKDDKGNVIGVVLIFRDITEQKKTEEEFQKIQKKLESLGIFAGGNLISKIPIRKFKMERMVKCWEFINCDKTHCPAYGVNLHCWLLEDTLCVEGQLTHKEKLQKHCLNCQVLIEEVKMSRQTGDIEPQPLDIRDYALDEMSSRLSFINEHLEDEISKLLLLNKINMLLGSKHDIDERLSGILTAVTAGYGLSFNRAMLLLVNETQNMLECVLAIAPTNQEDAHQIWTDVESKYQSLEELLMTLPKQPMMDSRVEEIIKDLKIPITREFGVLALTVIEGRPFNITDAVNDPKVNQKCRKKIGTTAFATIPLWGREKVIGVIAVDNAFNNHPITDEDVAILSVFAGHAGFMIEQSKLHAKLGEQLVQLQELQERLLESERLATWGKMAGVLAHEIRNPLVPIGGFANRLYKSFPEEDKRKEEAAIIVKEVEKLEMILNNLLRSGQLPPPELQVSNINKIVRDTLLFMDNELQQKRIRTVTDLSPDLPDVMVDDCQMQQVFLNLFQNSVRAMADGGELQIGTANDDKFVLIDVTDTGMGISKDVMKRIFDPFFTTNEQGFGIGLSVVKQIVEAHNGAIDVKSQLNVGTTFSISLPILAEKIS